MKVSVVIPTYNRATFITNALNSVIRQGYDHIEIIVVDDGSTDNTHSVVKSMQRDYSNIFYYQNERSKGPSGARNTGIIKSSGDYLLFLDSDDIWLDGHLTNALKILTEHPEIDVLFGNFSIVDFSTGNHRYDFFDQKKSLYTLKTVELSPKVKMVRDNVFQALIQGNFFSLGTSIIRRSLTDRILLDESILFAEDRDFAIKLCKEGNATFAYREEPVCIAYRHDSNLNDRRDLTRNQQLIESHLYLFAKYLRCYDPTYKEKRILYGLFCKRLVCLASIHRIKKEYRNALLCILRSVKYGLSLDQLIEAMKIMVILLQIPRVWFS